MSTCIPSDCSPHETHARLTAGSAWLIDVRTPGEYRALHAVGATLMPMHGFSAGNAAASAPVGSTIHLLCKSGGRATRAAQQLAAAGHPCVVVAGGTDAWAAAGLPVVCGTASMSLERQVRIAAGLLTFTGVVLGYAVHPYWFGLSGFVGAGLTIAGLTDTCMMGMVIARMPWNR